MMGTLLTAARASSLRVTVTIAAIQPSVAIGCAGLTVLAIATVNHLTVHCAGW